MQQRLYSPEALDRMARRARWRSLREICEILAVVAFFVSLGAVLGGAAVYCAIRY